MRSHVVAELRNLSQLIADMLEDEGLVAAVEEASGACVRSLSAGGKILLAGNGGSAADAQHFAAELVGRFMLERGGLAAIALTTDAVVLTAIGNDYGFEKLFMRHVQAHGKPGDVLIGFSTSGQSRNILLALEAARAGGLVTVGLAGGAGGAMMGLCDHLISVPSASTQRIQECHLVLGHVMCGLIEQVMFPSER